MFNDQNMIINSRIPIFNHHLIYDRLIAEWKKKFRHILKNGRLDIIIHRKIYIIHLVYKILIDFELKFKISPEQ